MPQKKKAAAGKQKTGLTAGKGFYIAGIGGSAGSLEALEQFFTNMPADSGIAFVLIQHLDPTHKDILPELLQRFTKMPVQKAIDGVKVRPNNVYVIPPNKDMAVSQGRLRLTSPAMPRGQRLPIDFFFRSLAEDAEERAVGIIFSGMGTDGTLGVKALKDKLGMVMVQAADEAKYDSMPRSALDTGLADFTAPAAKLPARLVSYVRHFVYAPAEPEVSKQAAGTLQKVLALVRGRTGHDFSFYKKNTVFRRIERRMSVHQLATLPKYLRYLQLHPDEQDNLFKELLIGVTSFFRDPQAFEAVKKALPAVLRGKPRKSLVRVWAVGCSTGEEAYSLAILLKEYLQETKQENDYRVQIFATDIDKAAVGKARQGLYPANISADVSPERLHRYFTKEETSYRVRKEIREMIVFAPQNLINDPPFTKLDILCCRNLLIYLTQEIQKKILPLFHYSLNPSGLLLLGSSETIGSLSVLFSTVDSKWKLFARKELAPAAKSAVELPLLPAAERKRRPSREEAMENSQIPLLAMERLLETFAPPAVFIGETGDILYVSGRTGRYLEPAAGEASMNAFTMAREGLRFELAGAVRKAVRSKQDVTVKDLKVRTDDGSRRVNLTVKPFVKPESLRGVLMVVFEEQDAPRPPATRPQPHGRLSKAGQNARLTELEDELKFTKEHLQTTVEEMETSQEELKSANEELQSTNEELQSTNEELTTSKEELQSLNEELITVNAELQNKVEELSRTNNDMKNLLNSTEIATIFLDNELNVKRFTAPATRIVNLIATDVGRPIGHLVSNLRYETLEADVREVLKTLVFKEMHIETKNGAWYLMRIIPYRTLENVIDGVVITFTDFTGFKKLEQRCLSLEAELKRGKDAEAGERKTPGA
jgi:two-component system CheB/CheR fusion protein